MIATDWVFLVVIALLAVAALLVTRNRAPKPEPVAIAGELPRYNPIKEPIVLPARPLPPPSFDPASLQRIHVGTCADGSPWTIELGAHTLIAGESGSGKSGFIWSLLGGMGPGIKYGMVQVWAVDPKLGAELGWGEPLFRRFAYQDFKSMAVLLEDAVEEMHRRAASMFRKARKHVPSVEQPIVVILIDELASLIEDVPADLKKKFVPALTALLRKGRAFGFYIVGATQDPRKEALPFRHLFQVKIAMRVERLQVDMLLGDGARERGAYCDRISRKEPGTAYVVERKDEPVDGKAEDEFEWDAPYKVRSFWVSDEEIDRLVTLYGRPS